MTEIRRCGVRHESGLECWRDLGHTGQHVGYLDVQDENVFWGFSRTSCACEECVACCKRQPGALAPGEFERIAEFLGEDRETAKKHFWASPGALVMDTQTGRMFRIGTITPRMERKRCVFLDEQDRCRIHPVAPFGCSMFDTHMSADDGRRRGSWLAAEQQQESYQALRRELPFASSYKPKGY